MYSCVFETKALMTNGRRSAFQTTLLAINKKPRNAGFFINQNQADIKAPSLSVFSADAL